MMTPDPTNLVVGLTLLDYSIKLVELLISFKK